MAGDAGIESKRQRSGNELVALSRLHRKVSAAVEEALLPAELPRVVIHGASGSAIVGTDSRALVLKLGLKAGVPLGCRLKAFEYEHVMKVCFHPGESIGVVVIHAPLKIAVCPIYWADQRDDPFKARNAIAVELPDPRVDAGTAKLAALVAEFQRGHARPTSKTAEPEPATELPKPVVLKPRDDAERPMTPQPLRPPGPQAYDCPRCGAVLRVNWRFCPRCGAPAEVPAPRSRRRSS
jgi:hypothetical protein